MAVGTALAPGRDYAILKDGARMRRTAMDAAARRFRQTPAPPCRS